jgi:hypothetical protein
LTIAFGIVGAAAAWTVRCTVEALVMLWLSGMKRGDFLLLLPPAALLAASLIMARFLGSSPVITFPVRCSSELCLSFLAIRFPRIGARSL